MSPDPSKAVGAPGAPNNSTNLPPVASKPSTIDRGNNRPPFETSLIHDSKVNLPAVYHDPIKHRYYPLDGDYPQHVKRDLDIERINVIFKWLWLCGSKIMPRPLHRQRGFMGRELIIIEQADLHLTWNSDTCRMFIKPLPAYLLDLGFWDEYLCKDTELYRNALGFLRTYIHLLPHEIDFDIAIEDRLLPKIYRSKSGGSTPATNTSGSNQSASEEYERKDLTWPAWKKLVAEFVKLNDDAPQELKHTRWEHGELRLDRLNLVYRFAWGSLGHNHLWRGYLFDYFNYGSWISRNSAWLIALFAYIAVVHGAMQVGLSTTYAEDNDAFQKVSYIFAVITLVGPVAIVFILFTVVFVMVVDNALFAVKFVGRKAKSSRREHHNLQQNGKGADPENLSNALGVPPTYTTPSVVVPPNTT